MKPETESCRIVPMDADVVWNMIDNLNNQSVSFSNNNSRPGKLPIDCHHALCVAQSRDICQPYLEKAMTK